MYMAKRVNLYDLLFLCFECSQEGITKIPMIR